MPELASPPPAAPGAGSQPPPASPADRPPVQLFAPRVKVYPRAVRGPVRRAKWIVLALCLAIYYLVPWIRWDRGPGLPDQAILIDMAGRRAYLFDLEIWPQEIWLLAGLLILAAVSLFLVTSLFGRVWCGFTCPQTVWTDLFMWVERQIEGDRNARMRLDAGPPTLDRALRKSAKHGAWLVIAAATGGAWIMYFVDAPTVVGAILGGSASTQVYFFFGLFTATTYVLAGWAREQVCTYMCPWPRFQAAMLDEQTLTVAYRDWRGEPRGKHKAGATWEGRGDCIDCQACVAVCPTGIDIRNGLQLECIGCGLCVDACDEMMVRVDRPTRLIGWSTEAEARAQAAGVAAPAWRLVRPRTLLYAAILALMGGLLLWGVAARSTAALTVLQDRAPIAVLLSDGSIRNGYTLKILNKTHETRLYAVAAVSDGFDGVQQVQIVGADGLPADPDALGVPPGGQGSWHLMLTRPADAPSEPIAITVTDLATGAEMSAASSFVHPGG